jgi:hypothetical protein
MATSKKQLFCHSGEKASKIFCAESSNFFGNLLATWSFLPKMLMKLMPSFVPQALLMLHSHINI